MSGKHETQNVTQWELAEVERANASGLRPVVFVHGRMAAALIRRRRRGGGGRARSRAALGAWAPGAGVSALETDGQTEPRWFLRYSRGLSPKSRRNARVKLAWSGKPQL